MGDDGSGSRRKGKGPFYLILFPGLFLDVISCPQDKHLHSIYKTCIFLLEVRT